MASPRFCQMSPWSCSLSSPPARERTAIRPVISCFTLKEALSRVCIASVPAAWSTSAIRLRCESSYGRLTVRTGGKPVHKHTRGWMLSRDSFPGDPCIPPRCLPYPIPAGCSRHSEPAGAVVSPIAEVFVGELFEQQRALALTTDHAGCEGVRTGSGPARLGRTLIDCELWRTIRRRRGSLLGEGDLLHVPAGLCCCRGFAAIRVTPVLPSAARPAKPAR